MGTSDAATGQVATDAAEVYDEFFVPALFGQWSETTLDAAGVGPGDRVLDVGCGTGRLARAAADRVGPDGEVVGVDVNDGMLAVARRDAPGVTWRRAAAEDLPFPDGRFDRVLSQFVWMFLEDRVAAAHELSRVLDTGGTIAIATWAAVDESPGYASMIELLQRTIGDGAADALRAPFVIGTAAELRALLAPVFPDVSVARHEGTARFESVEAWLHTDIRGWTLSDMIDDEAFDRLLDAAPSALAAHVGDDGRVRFPAPALVATASRPG